MSISISISTGPSISRCYRRRRHPPPHAMIAAAPAGSLIWWKPDLNPPPPRARPRLVMLSWSCAGWVARCLILTHGVEHEPYELTTAYQLGRNRQQGGVLCWAAKNISSSENAAVVQTPICIDRQSSVVGCPDNFQGSHTHTHTQKKQQTDGSCAAAAAARHPMKQPWRRRPHPGKWRDARHPSTAGGEPGIPGTGRTSQAWRPVRPTREGGGLLIGGGYYSLSFDSFCATKVPGVSSLLRSLVGFR